MVWANDRKPSGISETNQKFCLLSFSFLFIPLFSFLHPGRGAYFSPRPGTLFKKEKNHDAKKMPRLWCANYLYQNCGWEVNAM
jgi:hypothetical protein